MKKKSDLTKMEDKLKPKTAKNITREEFEALKLIIKEIIIKLQTRNF